MRAVLVGAGHAHLHAIRKAAEFGRRGHDLVVIAPGAFWYSGLATGMLGGLYPPELDRIDVGRLAARGGARFIHDRMTGLNRAAGEILLERGGRIPFDVLSLNLGSAPHPIPGSELAGVFSVKPIRSLYDLRQALEQRFEYGGEPVRVVIAGAGATGAELAGNLAGLAATNRAAAQVTILAGGAKILKQLPAGAAQAVRANLEARGVEFRTDSRAARLEEGSVVLEQGKRIPFDFFLNATGLHPPRLLEHFDLPLSDDGSLVVDAHLRSPADARIHGGGDCVALQGRALPRIGVYAIRQAPVLLHNLLAGMEGAAPRRFRPQRQYLWIMNLGDGTGVAIRGRHWFQGRVAFRLKDWLDRRFLAADGDG